MATSSDIITLSAKSHFAPPGAPISLNTVCAVCRGKGEVEAREQEQCSTAVDFLHEDSSAAHYSEVSWSLGGIYLNIFSSLITLSIYKRNTQIYGSILPVGYFQALSGKDERVSSCITLRLVGLSTNRAAKMRAENPF